MRRTLAACVLPALAISVAWLRLEEPRRSREALAFVALAIIPALFPRWWLRLLALLAAGPVAVWLALDVPLWDAAPFRDRHVVAPLVDVVSVGLGDFYGVVLPFDPGRNPEMHGLLLLAIFGFLALTALLVASRHLVAAAGTTVFGAGWAATLTSADAVAIGALALAAALSIFLALQARSVRALTIGAAAAGLVVAGASWATTATTFVDGAVLSWENWDFRGLPAKALGVRFVWEANYDGIRFPPTETVVLEIEGPEQAEYWRASTLDVFTADRWLEVLHPVAFGSSDRDVPLDALAPATARAQDGWLEQSVRVKALVDDRIVAAGMPVALSARSLGTVFYLSGGVIRARHTIRPGTQYRVWSYVPDPSPATLARTPARYPSAARRFLTVWGQALPPFGERGRDARLQALLGDPHFAAFGAYRPLYEEARRVAGDARNPYEAVLDLESWFRRGGGFRYDEQPRRSFDLPPLVHFVTVTKAGYCQHFAGAMAVMLRMLGIPSRVAVGFTSGRRIDGKWRITDHNAHAWVEVWFPGQGWVAFDPTPGRGTFSGIYSFASENAQAVEALGRGELDGAGGTPGRGLTERDLDPVRLETADERPSLLGLALFFVTVAGAAVGLAKWLVRKARYLSTDPRRIAAASRRELEAFLRDQGVAVPASATLDDLREAVRDELGLDGDAFVQAAGRGRFGTPEQSRHAADAARRELRKLLRRVRRELSLWSRLRGFVSLRSLRGGWGL